MDVLRGWLAKHVTLSIWLVLALGMVVIVLVAMRGQELSAAESGCMVGGAVLLAGGCAWILSWE
jgi:hypothetical protein